MPQASVPSVTLKKQSKSWAEEEVLMIAPAGAFPMMICYALVHCVQKA
jgi:hypothetical protein